MIFNGSIKIFINLTVNKKVVNNKIKNNI